MLKKHFPTAKCSFTGWIRRVIKLVLMAKSEFLCFSSNFACVFSRNIASMSKKELHQLLKKAGCKRIKLKRKIESKTDDDEWEVVEFGESDWQKRSKPNKDEMGTNLNQRYVWICFYAPSHSCCHDSKLSNDKILL